MLEFVADPELPSTGDKVGVVPSIKIKVIASIEIKVIAPTKGSGTRDTNCRRKNIPLELIVQSDSARRGTDTIVQMLEFIADPELPGTRNKLRFITSVQIEVLASEGKHEQLIRSAAQDERTP